MAQTLVHSNKKAMIVHYHHYSIGQGRRLTVSGQTAVCPGSFMCYPWLLFLKSRGGGEGHDEGTQDPLEPLPAVFQSSCSADQVFQSPNPLQVLNKSKLTAGGCQPDI